MDPTLVFTGSAATWAAGDLSGVVASGSTKALLRFKNTSDVAITLHVRKTGSTDDAPFEVLPGLYTGDITISLTAARTVEYYIEGGGSIRCEVLDYGGSGLTADNTTYTTAAKVASLLRLRDTSADIRLVFDTTTDPTLAEVENFIFEAEDDIDRSTNHAWRAKTITNEYHDVRYLYTQEYRREIPVKLLHRSIRTLVSGTDKVEYWNGSAWADLVATGTEGRANTHWVDYTNGIVYFVTQKPYWAVKGVRFTYQYGETSVPYDIQEAATKLAAIKILEDNDYLLPLPEGGNVNYALGSKVDSWKKDIERILNNHREILLA